MFKIGDNVIYIRKDKLYNILSLHNKYEVLDVYLGIIEVLVGTERYWYDETDFISLSEYRRQKINKLKIHVEYNKTDKK